MYARTHKITQTERFLQFASFSRTWSLFALELLIINGLQTINLFYFKRLRKNFFSCIIINHIISLQL